MNIWIYKLKFMLTDEINKIKKQYIFNNIFS